VSPWLLTYWTKTNNFRQTVETTTVPSFKSFRSGVFALSCSANISTHTYTHIHRDKVIAISALPSSRDDDIDDTSQRLVCSTLVSISELILHRARLVTGWATLSHALRSPATFTFDLFLTQIRSHTSVARAQDVYTKFDDIGFIAFRSLATIQSYRHEDGVCR